MKKVCIKAPTHNWSIYKYHLFLEGSKIIRSLMRGQVIDKTRKSGALIHRAGLKKTLEFFSSSSACVMKKKGTSIG